MPKTDSGGLSVRSATVRVGKKVLLDNVSFELPEGKLLAVIGPSGAGKTTLMRAMSGQLEPYSGSVTFDGLPSGLLRDEIGMVPQDDILHRQLTVSRALDYAAQLRLPGSVGKAERAARIAAALAQLGLADRAGQRISTLSGGQRKRVSVALELLTDPALLFLDEPTSGLDPALDRDVMTHLRALTQTGRTVVVITHSVLHLDAADYVLALAPGGRVAYYGAPGGLLDAFAATDYAQVFDRLGWWDVPVVPTASERPIVAREPSKINTPGFLRQTSVLAPPHGAGDRSRQGAVGVPGRAARGARPAGQGRARHRRAGRRAQGPDAGGPATARGADRGCRLHGYGYRHQGAGVRARHLPARDTGGAAALRLPGQQTRRARPHRRLRLGLPRAAGVRAGVDRRADHAGPGGRRHDPARGKKPAAVRLSPKLPDLPVAETNEKVAR